MHPQASPLVIFLFFRTFIKASHGGASTGPGGLPMPGLAG